MALSSKLRLALLLPHTHPASVGRNASATEDLTDSLARQAEHIADFLKGLALPVQPADDRLALQVSFRGSHGRYLAHNFSLASSG